MKMPAPADGNLYKRAIHPALVPSESVLSEVEVQGGGRIETAELFVRILADAATSHP